MIRINSRFFYDFVRIIQKFTKGIIVLQKTKCRNSRKCCVHCTPEKKELNKELLDVIGGDQTQKDWKIHFQK